MAGNVVVMHPATEAVAAISRQLDNLAAADLWSVCTAALGELLVAVEKVARRLDAARVALTAQAEAAFVAEREGATSLAGWLKAVADVPITATKARLRLHEALETAPVAAAAFACGDISLDAATAVCDTLDKLVANVPAALTGQVEQLLVETARDEGTRAVMHRGTELVHRFAPGELERREALLAEHTRLRLVQRHDGSVALRGLLDKQAGALAVAVLGPLAAPAPAADGTADTREADIRFGEAFVHVLRQVGATEPNTGGEPPHLLISISLDALQTKLGAAAGVLLDTSTPISAGSARRLACDAQLIPMVLGAASEPLDIGRATRVVPIGLRRAVIARDQGCAMPGCDRPPSWCDVHHCTHWADGGKTALCNTCLLCERHHTIVHHQRWHIQIKDGLPWFTPPTWIDPTQTPRLHSRYKTRKLGP